MRRAWEGLVIAVLAAACTPLPPEPPTSAAIRDDYGARMDKLIATRDGAIVWPLCSEPRKPGRACGLIAADFFAKKRIRGIVLETCGESIADKISDECINLVGVEFRKRLALRYTYTTQEAVRAACERGPSPCETAEQVELVWLDLHDTRVLSLVGAEMDRLVVEHRRAQASADTEREARRAEEEKRKAVARAFAAGLKAYGDALQAPTRARPATPTGCTDDNECPGNTICLRTGGAARGTCADLIDRTGSPSTDPGAKTRHGYEYTQCPAKGCPAGFHCEQTDHGGACVQ